MRSPINLRSTARGVAGKAVNTIRLSREPLDLGQLVQEVASSLGTLAEERNQRLTFDITAKVVVSADRVVHSESACHSPDPTDRLSSRRHHRYAWEDSHETVVIALENRTR